MIRIVKLSFKEEYIENFLFLFEERKQRIRNFEGCNYLELWQDKSEKGVFYTYSIWQDASDLENYRISDLFQDTWTHVKQWFNHPPKAFSADKIMCIS